MMKYLYFVILYHLPRIMLLAQSLQIPFHFLSLFISKYLQINLVLSSNKPDLNWWYLCNPHRNQCLHTADSSCNTYFPFRILALNHAWVWRLSPHAAYVGKFIYVLNVCLPMYIQHRHVLLDNKKLKIKRINFKSRSLTKSEVNSQLLCNLSIW